MNWNIDTKIVKQTSKCDKNFACLKDAEHVCCQVKGSIVGGVHFITCLEVDYCNYKASYGYEYYCTCPIRREIYIQHGV